MGLILSLDRVTAGRAHAVLDDLTWSVREGELWTVMGPNGAGKSSLLRVLRGEIPIIQGELRYGRHPSGRALATDPVGELLTVSFSAQATLLKGAAGYSQSRWHAGQDEAAARGRDVLGPVWGTAECRRIVEILGLAPLLERRVTELSNGERRRLVLARAAGRRPAVLALDNPFNGLDAQARESVSSAVKGLHDDGMTLLVTTSREDEIPEAATHVLLVDRGRAVTSGRKETVLADERFARILRSTSPAFVPTPRAAPASPPDASAAGNPVVELRDVDLRYGGADVLYGLSWTVRRGERWVVVGPNGAGKSALLSLILADNPQAYANDVSLFGRRRGTGDTIWEIRRRIGAVSPEMHLYQELDWSVLDVIESGFHDPARPRRSLTAKERHTAEQWLGALHLEGSRDRLLRDLSEGELQAALLARALAKGPELLVLDEPCQGLDALRRARFLDLLDRALDASGTTLIYVTHDLDEVPSVVRHGLLLRRGRAVLQGSAEEVLNAHAAAGPTSAGAAPRRWSRAGSA